MKPVPRPLRILISDAHELAGLGSVRSLGRAGHRVTAGYPQDKPAPAALRSHWCAGSAPYPDPWRRHFDFRAWLLAKATSGEFDAILPLGEATAAALHGIREQLPAGVLAILPTREHLAYTLSKYQACLAAQRAGLALPPTRFIADGQGSWDPNLAGLSYPIIFKVDNRLAANGAYISGRSVIAENPAEAEALLREHETTRPGMLAQEHAPGYGIGTTLLRWGGQTRLNFTHRRLHEVPWSGGPASLRVSLHDTALTRAAERLLAEIGYGGLAEVEFRRSAPDSGPQTDCFMEFKGWLRESLALALHCGVDFPRGMVELARGAEFKPKRPVGVYLTGRRCRNTLPGELYYMISVLKSRRTAEGPQPPSKLGSALEFVALTLNPCVRRDYFWWSDPAPWFAQARAVFKDLTQRACTKLKTRRRAQARAEHLDGLRNRHSVAIGRPGLLDRPPRNILFLCFGNICRSPLAEFEWNAQLERRGLEAPRAQSAGFFDQIGRRTPERFEAIIRSMGLDLSSHRSKMATRGMIDAADMILVMDMENYEDLLRIFPDAADKTWLLGLFAGDGEAEVIDPYILPPTEAHTSYLRLQRATRKLFQLVNP